MFIRPDEPFMEKRKKLDLVPAGRRLDLMKRLSRGETVEIVTSTEILKDPLVPVLTQLLKEREIDLTKNEELYFLVNKFNVPLSEHVARKKYDAVKKGAKEYRERNDSTNGFWDGRTGRMIGAIPAEIYQIFVEKYPDGKERELAVQSFLRKEGKTFATVSKGI